MNSPIESSQATCPPIRNRPFFSQPASSRPASRSLTAFALRS